MILTIKKRVLITLISIFLAVCILGAIVIVAFMQNETNKTQMRTNDYTEAESRGTVVLDAGHGGPDGGVLGVNTGTKEADINLAITLKLKEEFIKGGYNVVLTRSTQEGLTEEGQKWSKKTDMKKRKETICAGSFLGVISIHCNRFPAKTRRGAQVFFNDFSEKSETFSCCIQSKLNIINMRETHNLFSNLKGDYFILKCSNDPAIIIECGFLSNSEDEILLISDSYQQELAATIYSGADEYFRTLLN